MVALLQTRTGERSNLAGVELIDYLVGHRSISLDQRRQAISAFIDSRNFGGDVLFDSEKRMIRDPQDCLYMASLKVMNSEELKAIYHRYIPIDSKHYGNLKSAWENDCRWLAGQHLGHNPSLLEFNHEWYDLNHNSGRFRGFYCEKFPDRVVSQRSDTGRDLSFLSRIRMRSTPENRKRFMALGRLPLAA